MDKPIIEKPRVRDLIKIGISAGHASEMLSGKKSPSLEMARRIEVATGYPMSAWPEKS
jgi:transcriptional regulator with XRE-family HTH domain